jgi:predicted nucleotidyltransferase
MNLNLVNISPLPIPVIEFLHEICKSSQIHRLIVFGSRAHDDYEQYSDIDLAVDAPEITKQEWLNIKETAYYDVRTVLQISLVHYNTNPQKLQNNIINTGEIIYVKH